MQPNKKAVISDIKQSDWHPNMISTEVRAGLIQGFSDGTSHPDDPIMREQMGRLLAKAITIVKAS